MRDDLRDLKLAVYLGEHFSGANMVQFRLLNNCFNVFKTNNIANDQKEWLRIYSAE